MIPPQVPKMAALGCRLVPIAKGEKYPPIEAWQIHATSDAETHKTWWDIHSEWGVGWKMGLQDDGRFLVAIDVDTAKGGRESMKDLIIEYGLREAVAGTTTARTGGGGYHFVFEIPPDTGVHNRAKLRPGIDVRAEGGQICVAPTIHPSGTAYAWATNKAPWELAPRLSPEVAAMLTDLTAQAPQRPAEPRWHPSMGNGTAESPADYVRAHYDWMTYLLKWGWTHVGGERWKRPGKTERGHSAILHNDGQGPLVIFTTDIPPGLERVGTRDATGQAVTVSLYSFIAAYEHGGDEVALGRTIRERHLNVFAAPSSNGTEHFDELDWSASPLLSHVLAAARSEMVSPEALLVHALCRISALIPPCYRLPGIRTSSVGMATLDLMGCVVSESGGGKTLVGSIGRDLVPDPARDKPMAERRVRFDLPLGSGEGLIDAFYRTVPEMSDDGKMSDVRRVWYQGLFMTCDEANAFKSMTRRTGVTIVETMNSAWSGETLGQVNADASRFRLIEAGTVRFAAVLNIQASNAYKLFDEQLTAVGFAGRLLFASALDPDATDDGAWPGALLLPAWPSYYAPVVLTYDPEIHEEIRAWRKAQVRGLMEPSTSSQHLVLTCKLAAIHALAGDRYHVSSTDWSVAKSILSSSRSTLINLQELDRKRSSDRRHILAEQRGEDQAVIETVKERQLIAKLAETIRRSVEVPTSPRKLARAVTSTKTRGRFKAALALAMSNGWIEVDGDTVRST